MKVHSSKLKSPSFSRLAHPFILNFHGRILNHHLRLPVTRWDLNQTHYLTSELERVEEDWLVKPSQNTTEQSTTGTSVIDDDDALMTSIRGRKPH